FQYGAPAFSRFCSLFLLPETCSDRILPRVFLDKPPGVALCPTAQHPHWRKRYRLCPGVLPHFLWYLLSRLPVADHYSYSLHIVWWRFLWYPPRRPARIVGISLRRCLGWYRISAYLVAQSVNGFTTSKR